MLHYLHLVIVLSLCMFTQTIASPRVIIVGAGVAGLTAAQELTRKSDAEVIVLEARDRIGGRLCLDQSLGVPVDLGASWIHHSESNPLLQYCQAQGIRTVPAPYQDSQVYHSGAQLSSEQTERFWFSKNAFCRSIERLAADKGGCSLKELSKGSFVWSEEDPIPHLAALWSLAWEYEIENAADARELDPAQGPPFFKSPSVDHILPEGYWQVAKALSKDVDVRLNHVVREVHWSDNGVHLVTSQGDLDADLVILTLPLGVLKAGTVRFDPPIPEPKQRAIDRLQMGVLAKVTLRFPHVFWPKEPLYFMQLTRESRFFPLWINDYRANGQPVLSTQIGGKFGAALEHMNQEEQKFQVMRSLRQIFGGHIPEPENFVVTRWSSDPFAEGSYSFVPPGADESEFDRLAEPMGAVLFAGEATHRENFATVHGAYESGLREARSIMARLKN